MKKILSAIIALVMILSLSCAVFAAETEFVPSISEKGEPEIDGVKLVKDGEVLDFVTDDCLYITAIARITRV